jgi:DNA-binding response OmpR family regulator
MRILFVEDDRLFADGICASLRQRGFAVEWLEGGRAAALALESEAFDLLILDLRLPDQHGFDLLRRLRRHGSRLPILIVTACDGLPERIEGLNGGADDYLIKPFALAELEARIRALHRRTTGRAETILTHGELRLDPTASKLTVDGHEQALTPREFALLQALLERSGKVVTRAKLEQSMYEWDDELGSNALEVHIHNLRAKLGKDLIRTVRGVGYIVENERA